MFMTLCLVLLLPLALTSPYLAPYTLHILEMVKSLLFFVVEMTRKHLPDMAVRITHYAFKLNCSKKCRTQFIQLVNKYSLGAALIKSLIILSALVPKNVRILITKGPGTIFRANLQTLTNKLFADRMTTVFVCLFIFRYLRLVVHLVSFWLFYRPAPIPNRPTVRQSDCTVILPTVDPTNPDFEECLTSCLINEPGVVIIVPVGSEMTHTTKRIVAPYQHRFPGTKIRVKPSHTANKRIQVAHGLGYVNTKITVLLDDHVFWPSARFLPAMIAPFEDPKIGIVGTNKRVRRTEKGLNVKSFWNMLGALYLERHNFEIRATNAMDGGVFVVSGRTSAHRSYILTDQNFLDAFTNERFFFNQFGPLNADDDNFITRWNVRNGYKVKIQYCNDACIETTLGTYPKFLSQCLRWVRTTWRSNSASLFTDRTVWSTQPWCVYAVYLTSFVNFALFYDAALIYTLLNSKLAQDEPNALIYLLRWIFLSKMVKLTPYFLREPQDILMLPGYFLFAYFHSLIKLYAGLTFWETSWGGRNLDAINTRPKSSPMRSPQSSPAKNDRRHTVINNIEKRDTWKDERHAVRERVRASATPVQRPRGRSRQSPTPLPSIETDPLLPAPTSSPVNRTGGTTAQAGPSGARRGRGRPKKS